MSASTALASSGLEVDDCSNGTLADLLSFPFSFRSSQEAKKMRKQRRMADLKDRQDRVRMGLIPPDAPKGESFPSDPSLSLPVSLSPR